MKSGFYTINLTDIRVSLRDLAAILEMLSFAMLLPLIATFTSGGQETIYEKLHSGWAFILPSILLYCLYGLSKWLGVEAHPKTKNIMITVVLAWTIIALIGAIPYMVRGALSPIDSFFESMSGWCTTGFSMIQNIENFDRDLLLYRGLSQGIGGLGIISLGMMVMLQGSSLAMGYSDIGVHKIKPGIRQTITESWKIYGLYILFGVVMLYIAGMNLFDAVNHSISAVATGGFTTHSSIGYYNSLWIELILVVLMVLGMTSFILHYRFFNGDYFSLKNEEVKFLASILVISILVLSLSIWGRHIPGVDTYSPFDVVRKTTFQVVSGMSTCGLTTVDFGKWPDFAKIWMIGLMYIGGMSSSTAGGIKVLRFVILLKAVHYSLKKLILPKTVVLLIKVDGRALRDDIITVVGFSAIYLFVCIMLALTMMLLGYGGVDSISTIMSAMSNDGMQVLSGDAWYHMPDLGKINIMLAMWIGRIEIYPGLLILKAFADRLR